MRSPSEMTIVLKIHVVLSFAAVSLATSNAQLPELLENDAPSQIVHERLVSNGEALKLGAPPISPQKPKAQKDKEGELRYKLEKLDRQMYDPISTNDTFKVLKGASQPMDTPLGNFVGMQMFMHRDLFAATSGAVLKIAEPDDHVEVHYDGFKGHILGSFGGPYSVHHVGNKFVFYFRQQFLSIVRTESTDGIHWENFQEITLENMLQSDFCVLHDEHETNKAHKWKVTYNCYAEDKEWHYLCIGTSEDGITWKALNDARPIYGQYTDTMPCLYRDGNDATYTLYQRWEKDLTSDLTYKENWKPEHRGIRGAVVLKGSLQKYLGDYGYHGTWDAVVANQWVYDQEYGEAEKYRRQVYATGRTCVGTNSYLGIGWVYEFPRYKAHPNEDKQFAAQENELYDSVRLYVLPSRDGVHFDHSWVYEGVPLFDTTKYHVMTAPGQIVTHAGYHWLYHDMTPARHTDRFDLTHAGENKIMLARYREGRIVGLAATGGTAVAFTKDFQFNPDLSLNLDFTANDKSSCVWMGLVRAGGKDADLMTQDVVAKSVPFCDGEDGNRAVRWTKPVGEFRGSRVHLRIEFTSATLYSFTFQ